MFSLRSFFRANRPQSEDELISAYLDGQLDQGTGQAFESRISADPGLRRRVETTRALVQAARNLPPIPAPRNFTLPRTMGEAAPQRSGTSGRDPRMGWRLGSAVAAAVFVLTIGLDAGGALVPRSAQPAASAALQPAQSLTYSPAVTGSPPSTKAAADAAKAATAANPANDSAQAPAPVAATPLQTPAPNVRAAVVSTRTQALTAGAGVTMEAAAPASAASQITPTQPIVVPSQRLSETNPITETAANSPTDAPAVALQPEITSVPSTQPAPELAVPAQTVPPEPAQPAPILLLDRAVAIVALLAAIGLGIMGWPRR